MKIFDFILNRGKKSEKKTDGFADFFRNASPEEKKRVFTEAARRANEDQRELFKRSGLKLESNQ